VTSPTLPQIIGISGYAGSGKSHLADLLARRHGYRVAHFADPLREMCRQANPIIWMQPGTEPVRWAEVEQRFGYAAAKRHGVYGPEFRATLQRFGVAAREALGEDVWVDALFATIQPGERVVIGDMRFINEFRRVRRGFGHPGGMVVRIKRPGVGPVNGHESETALDGIRHDLTIVNDGEPEAMLDRLERHIAAVTA
jgi:hypothetical protein